MLINKLSKKQRISVGVVSLGCAKNLVDSQVMAGVLMEHGMRLAPVIEKADVLLVNTCSFIGDARDESAMAIRKACDLKRYGGCSVVIVAGCLPQRYKADLFKQFPFIDAIVGVDDLEEIGAVISRVLSAKRAVKKITDKPARVFNPSDCSPVFTAGAYAYIKIAEGCNHSCSFCAIPGIRGKYRSRKALDIQAEAEKLLSFGFKELTLVAQDTTRYGTDLNDGENLPSLLEKLDSFGGDYWVRFLYAYPDRITDRLLDVVAGAKHICPYFDVPIQHSHPDVLKAMRRGGTVERVKTLAHRIRARIPDAVVRTTLLVGFPGETKEHFSHLMRHIEDARYDNLGVFEYSKEEGTRAGSMRSTVSGELAKKRRKELMQKQRYIVGRTHKKLVGTEDIILLEKKLDKGIWSGRSRRQAPEVDGNTIVLGVPDRKVKHADFVKCEYVRRHLYDLTAQYKKSGT